MTRGGNRIAAERDLGGGGSGWTTQMLEDSEMIRIRGHGRGLRVRRPLTSTALRYRRRSRGWSGLTRARPGPRDHQGRPGPEARSTARLPDARRGSGACWPRVISFPSRGLRSRSFSCGCILRAAAPSIISTPSRVFWPVLTSAKARLAAARPLRNNRDPGRALGSIPAAAPARAAAEHPCNRRT